MRIGVDYTSAICQGAGIGRLTRCIFHALAEVDQENEYRLFVATGRNHPSTPPPFQPSTPPTFHLKTIPLSDRGLNIVWHRLRLPLPVELITGAVDVFHSPDFTLPPVWRARTVLTVHDLSFLRVPQCFTNALRRYLEQVVPRSVSRADHVIADSESTKRDLAELLGTPADKVTVIYSGVEPRFRPITDRARLEAVRRRYNLPERFILSVGTLQPRKNFGVLIEAFSRLKVGTGSCKLVIVGGKGWLYEDIFARVEGLGLQGEVSFPSFVADEDLPAIYNLAEVFALPSLYEGFGLPPLEAMACGTPVVTSNTSSLPEVVGDAGLMVEPMDVDGLARAMARLLEDGDLRREMAQRGLARAREFTWERAARQLLAVYTGVMRGA
ncbi:MAG: glycosyltransferase family 4 protein [Anaerolineae bacterium]|jgi:glycosyltransferase involved in cell wall biosynthesis|nr:glycosyltransferase family 4 protein [Anaerolineae bacterium]MDH7472565.1 glycosyltransferase family 1 protein [Anaerolineae bacterium]